MFSIKFIIFAHMRITAKILSIILTMILLVETIGFNHIRHCCGYDDYVVALTDLSDLSEAGMHEDMEDGCTQMLKQSCACSSHHHHHHDASCFSVEYLHLKSDLQNKTVSFLAQIFIPQELQLFLYEPVLYETKGLTSISYPLKIEPGRAKLALFSTLLI